MTLEPVTVTETVQARGETTTRSRETVQDTTKLPRLYTLAGETVMQKLESFRAYIAANRVYHQLELLGYLEDVTQAPLTLETYTAEDLDVLG